MKVKKLLRLNYIREKERLNKNFLHEFKEYDFSHIDESKIFLVGSIKFRDYFVKIESILQILYDKLVTICSIDGLLNKEKFASKEWDILQKIALKKLQYQEAILVLDVNDYVGEHSKEEIEYFSVKLKRPIYYLSKLKKPK
ncbi:MAG: hypothetical protein CEE43_18460 [Promethearchaeota archaeon Loki_b32]|nr:MAG: hypothetical protein CEE43_18460 [Candidatus Lokiarchaeota archaeon Loki_b32]